MQMVSHGLMTALFFAAIGMIYDRTLVGLRFEAVDVRRKRRDLGVLARLGIVFTVDSAVDRVVRCRG